MSNKKQTSDKVLKAMTLNQKEDRVLAKTFGTLDLEKKFATNVLDLHLRGVRSNYRHLKEKVSKIRSNLSPDEIMTLRQLDVEGKLKPPHSFNLNAAMKIAAAARRLNLYPEGVKRSKSASAVRTRTRDSDRLLQNRSQTEDNILKRKRSNSVTGVFIDAPAPDNTERRNSIEGNITLRPISAHVHDNEETKLLRSNQKSRPSTTSGTQKSPAPKVSFQSAAQKPVAQNAPFSSHEAVEKEAQGQLTNRTNQTDNTKSSSIAADDNFENNLGADLFEERRVELLQEENLFYSNLQKRKTNFMVRIDEYLEANPPVRFDTPLVTFPILRNSVNNNGSVEEPNAALAQRMRMVRHYDSDRTFTSEEAYREREGELWKDMNKTRYLRVPDDKIDLSGVVTLAKDQMKLFNLLRSTEPAHIVTNS